MKHRKWRETKQQPSTAGPGNMICWCLVSLHFLCYILCSLQYKDITKSRICSSYHHWVLLSRETASNEWFFLLIFNVLGTLGRALIFYWNKAKKTVARRKKPIYRSWSCFSSREPISNKTMDKTCNLSSPRPICPLLELHYVRMTSRTCSCRSGMRTNYVICWMEPWRNPLIRGPWVISVLTSVPLSNHVFLSTWITGKGGKIFYAILSVKWGAPALFFCHCTIPRKMWASVFLASIRKVIV